MILARQKLSILCQSLKAELKTRNFDPIHYSNLFTYDQLPFKILTNTLELVSETRGKDSKAYQKLIFSNFFRLVIIYKPINLVKSFYLSIGKLYPDYVETELGIGQEQLYKIISKTSGVSKKQVKSAEKSTGDLGQVIFSLKPDILDLPLLSIDHVYDSLKKTSLIHGLNSVNLKENELLSLISNASSEECKYIIRIMQKSLKIGASESTILEALSNAVEITPPNQDFPHKSLNTSTSLSNLTKQLIEIFPNYDILISELLKISLSLDFSRLIHTCKAEAGMPIRPMSANPVKSIEDLIDRFKNRRITCEYKYDGIRGQIHILSDKSIQIFSRTNENITEMFPDVVEMLGRLEYINSVGSCVIDCEIVAFDPGLNLLKSFNEIQQRKRKNVKINEITIKVCVFVFDLLLFNNINLMNHNLSKRREIYLRNFKDVPGIFQFVEYKNIEDYEEIETFLENSIENGCEGLIIKSLEENSVYEPGQRSLNWFKLKKDYLIKGSNTLLPDSLDLVPIGAYFGNGRRKGLYGSFLLAAFDSDSQEFHTVCKAGTGFTDEALNQLTEKLKQCEVNMQQNNIKSLYKPDIWIDPKFVWEIQGADISVSPRHTCGLGMIEENKGVSLRFPRFLRERNDKSPMQTTTAREIIAMYNSQVLSKPR